MESSSAATAAAVLPFPDSCTRSENLIPGAESRAFSEKPPKSSVKKMKKPKSRRRVLADLTNSDSPIAGLTPAPVSENLCDPGSPACFSSPGTPATPGIGEDLLRSQVNLLLQQVQADVPPRGVLFGFRSEAQFSCLAGAQQSPGMLVGPTPANTPVAPISTPTIGFPASSRSRLSKTSQYHKEEEEELVEESGGAQDSKLHRTISDLSKITIAETVTPLCFRTSKSLNFESLLNKLSSVAAADDDDEEFTTP